MNLQKMHPVANKVIHIKAVISLAASTPLFLYFILMKDFIFSIIKLEEMRIGYILIFYSLMLLALLKHPKSKKYSFIKISITGAMAGYFSGCISLFISNLFINNGIMRTINTVKNLGVLEVISIDFLISFILGTWILGIIVFNLYYFLENRIKKIY